MMTEPIEPHELSGLLDGQLDPQRAAEVRRAIEVDPGLRAEFDRLSALDRAWSLAARQAAFRPQVAWPRDRGAPALRVAAVALALGALVAVRLLPKVLDSAFVHAMALHGLVLAGLVAGLVWMARDIDTHDSATTQPGLAERSDLIRR